MSQKSNKKIKVTQNGPYLVTGGMPLIKENVICDTDGNPEKWEKGEKVTTAENYSLCRCGKSKNKPFCDGAHLNNDFDGTETASNEKYLNSAGVLEGPDLTLRDKEELCSGAGFCHRMGGTWDLTENSDDPAAKELATQQACDCPSGRLTAYDKKTGQAIEPKFEESISVTEMPASDLSGPLWVKGGVQIESAEGIDYEKRNRVTLCRCGKSKNKPFCDGAHLRINFSDKE